MSADMFSLSIPALEIRGWSSTSRAAGRRPARCSVAGIPAGFEFATKPALAVAILTRAVEAEVTAGGSPATRLRP